MSQQGEITVIQPIAEEEKVLSKEEREAQFKEIAAQTKIPLIYFDNIAKLEDQAAAQEALAVKPEILGLLIRKILDFDGVTAIVKTFPQRYLNIENIRVEFNAPKKTGSAQATPAKTVLPKKVKPAKTKLPRERKVSPGAQAKAAETGIVAQYVVNTQLTKAHNVFFLDDIVKHNARAPLFRLGYEPVDICGLIIDPQSPMIQYYLQTVPGNMPFRSRMMSGNYNESYFWTQLFSPYLNADSVQDSLIRLIPMAKKFGHTRAIIMFHDEASTRKICRSLLELCIYLRKYLLGDFVARALSQAAQIADASISKAVDLKGYSPFFRNLVERVFYTPEEVPVKELAAPEKPLGEKTKQIQVRLGEIEPYVQGKFSYRFTNSVWFDLASTGLLQLFEKIYYLASADVGKEQKVAYENDIAMALERLQTTRRAAAQRFTMESRMAEKVYQEMLYRHIYIQKFGYEKFMEAVKKMPRHGSVKSTIVSQELSLFNYITKREREVVELEYRNSEKFFQAMEESNLPWVKIVKQLSRAATKEQELKLFKELRKYLPAGTKKDPKKTDDWIRSEEGFPIICPHMRDKLELELAGKKPNDIRDFLFDYAGETPLYQAYYCRICGEVITYSDDMEGIVLFEGDQVVTLHNVEDGLKDFIWKQANQVVRNYIEFKDLKTNKFVNQFISGMVKNLYDFINLIDKKLRKSKTASLEETENKLKLYTVIYVYAMLIKIVMENATKIRFAGMKFSSSDSKSEKAKMAKHLFDYALNKIVDTQNVILNTLPDINEEFIQSKLLQAHKNIEALLTKSKIEEQEATDVVVDLLLDPVYLYMARMNIMHDLAKGKSYNDMTILRKRFDDINRPQILFGQDPNKVAKDPKSEHIYEHVKLPEPKKEWIAEFYELANPKKLAKDSRTKKPGVTRDEFMRDFYVGYFWESFRLFMQYVQSRTYIQPVFRVHIEKNPENENIYNISVALDEQLQKYQDDTENLRRAAAVLKDLRKYYNMPAYSKLPYVQNLQYHSGDEDERDLARKYGYEFNKDFDFKTLSGVEADKVNKKPHFHEHRWDIEAYATLDHFRADRPLKDYKSSQVQCFTKKVLKEFMGKPDFLNMARIDMVCSICFHATKGIEHIVKNPTQLLEEEQLTINFFNFYENRCPNVKKDAELFHDFHTTKGGEETCRNCGVTKNMLLDHDEDYFKKYRAQFIKDAAKEKASTDGAKGNESSLPINFDTDSAAKKLELKVPEAIKKWKFNANIVNEMTAKTFEIYQKGGKLKKTEYFNMLNNMGLSERLEYDKIITGAENPSKKVDSLATLARTRITRLETYIAELIADYHIMQNYKNLPTLPLEIKTLLGLAPGGLGKIDQIIYMYPSVESKLSYYEWQKNIRYMYVDTPATIANFLLECLYTLLLNILVHLTKKVNIKFAEGFMGYFINKIINMEKNVAKMKEQKAASIEASQKISTADEAAMQDHSQSREFDSEALAAEDQFSYEGMDYEGENEEYNT
jgi:hypothetical protein